jgi:outer membrane protein OmpA-like peptidoglycan-associated protein
MKKKSTLLVVVLFSCFSLLYAQDNAISNAINKNNIQFENNNSNSSNDAKKNIIPFWKGWRVGFSYGATKFNGDIRQYDHYPAYQKSVEFSELKTALSLSLIKKINPLFSLEGKFISGKFGGLNRTYSDVTISEGYYDNPYGGFHEGNGEKFETDFMELDASLLFDISKLSSYFSKSKKKRYSLLGKVGMGYNVYHALKTNLNTDTYIYSYGYADEGQGEVKKKFSESPSATVMLYGIKAGYPINKRMDINIELTKRTAQSDTWDASERKTKVLKDSYISMIFGLSYKLGNQINELEWESPIDRLKDDVSSLFVKIDGFTEDADNDGVSDAFDKNSTTPLGVAVDGSGIPLDVDMDNIPDYRDADPFSNRRVQVDVNGVELDDDKDGVPNSKDLESSTPVGAMVNQFGINVSNTTYVNSGGLIYFPSIYFNSGSAIVGSSNENRIATMALLLKSNPSIKLKVIGHTDNVGNAKFNKQLGLKRANAVINYFVLNYNVAADRLIATTKGEEDPLSAVTQIANDVETGESVNRLAEINRRVDFEIVN